MRKVLFTPLAFEQYNDWLSENKQIFVKLNKLIKEITKTPYLGSGNPEPLKHQYVGYWSRRITNEHRIVYKVEDDHIEFISCKYHY